LALAKQEEIISKEKFDIKKSKDNEAKA